MLLEVRLPMCVLRQVEVSIHYTARIPVWRAEYIASRTPETLRAV